VCVKSSKMVRLLFSLLWVLTFLINISGCAIHYFDEKTGADHVFGFGHKVMKVLAPKGSHQAIVTGTGKNKSNYLQTS
jgi:hypothetical protein